MPWKLKIDGDNVSMIEIDTAGTETGKTDSLPTGVITTAQLADQFVPKKEVVRRAKALAKTDPDIHGALLKNDEFKTKALGEWNIDTTTPAGQGGELTPEKISALKTNWETTVLAPVQTELQQLKVENGQLVKGGLHAQILSAGAAAGVHESFLKAPKPGMTPPIVNLVEPYFGLDPETKSWLVKDGEAFAMASNPTGAQLYKGVDEFMTEFTAQNTALVDNTRQAGPNVATGAKPAGPVDTKTEITRLEAAGDFGAANALKAQALQS